VENINRCCVCGRFISYDDLHNGKARVYMVYPDSHLTKETWEAFCPKHNIEANNERNDKGIKETTIS
jgi:hypothetical protein